VHRLSPTQVAETYDPLTDELAVDQNQSSSFVHKEGNFFIKYATPDSGVEGEYFIDDLALGDFKLKQVTMALATKARNVMEGSLGLGIPAGEAYVMSDNATTPYKTVLDEMIGQDLIKSRTFSIWLDSRSADIGNILFGGYDTAKFKGNLSFLDIQPPGNRFTVALTDLWLQVGDNTSDPSTSLTLPKPLPVVLDTGVTDMALPADLFESLAYYFGVTNTDIGYAVPCPTEDLVGEMSFQFGGGDGPVIHVPFSELFRPAHVDWSEVFTTPKEHDKDVCLFGITPSNEIASELLVLGNTFLRSAYVLFDLENSQIGIANALWNATDSNIVELPANGKVKSATTVTGVTVTQTASLLAQVPELFGMTTGSISLATPSSAMLSLPTNGHGAPTSSGSAASSSSASAAVAILEQSTLPVIVLALCGAIMLIATLII
jgi:hypothetical protein